MGTFNDKSAQRNLIFNELDHRLSVVKRWALLHTIQTQSVAEHMFNVQRIALRIALHWFDIRDAYTLMQIAMLAHTHDDYEALSGDLATMVKPYFNEEKFEKDHEDLISKTIVDSDVIKSIVKLADKLEGFHFLCIEKKLGNAYVDDHFLNYFREIETYVDSNFENCKEILDYVSELMGSFEIEISKRISRAGR